MIKTVDTEFGRFNYEPSALEEFVVELAKEWGADLEDMTPTQTWSYGPFIERKGKKEEGEKVHIWYTRNPSESTKEKIRQIKDSENYMREIAPLLYADNEPSSEFAHLTKGDKRVVVEFRSDGKKEVRVHVKEVADALNQTKKQATVYGFRNDPEVVRLDFNATAHREDHATKNPIGDMQNAFNFVKNYFGK